ncbi:ABC transporter substrate-binding protein [Georgenia alba]|uniref:ABC transporter substrate-binding protein n=1 Tax=Georgenia alba TaxID=2233858 RepID=A0ABW2Q7B0_9MICO
MNRIRRTAAAAAAATLLAVSACSQGGGENGSPDPGDGGSGGRGDFSPVTIEHAFGSTEITEQPQDVVTLGWGSTEAALALGVVPVGIEAQTYASNDAGQLPWVEEALQEADAEPTMLPSAVEEPPYEEIDELDPDVILAPYSGVTQEQYELLSEIAPTVAYPEQAWTTPWRDVIEITGRSLGLADEAETLVSDLDGQIQEAAAAHPELEGKTVAAIWDVGGVFYVYRPQDSRVDFLLDLGLTSAPAVDELASGSDTYVYELAYDLTSELEADVVVNYASSEEEVETFLDQSYAQAIPAVERGAVANIVGDELVAAMSPPTALSITWGLEEYVTEVSEAAAAAG